MIVKKFELFHIFICFVVAAYIQLFNSHFFKDVCVVLRAFFFNHCSVCYCFVLASKVGLFKRKASVPARPPSPLFPPPPPPPPSLSYVHIWYIKQHLNFGGCFRAQRGLVAMGRRSLCVRRIIVERAGEVHRQEGGGGTVCGTPRRREGGGGGGCRGIRRRRPEEGALRPISQVIGALYSPLLVSVRRLLGK